MAYRKVIRKQQDGNYKLADMTEDDMRSLVRMIDSACLPERQYWHHIKLEILEILK